MHIIRLNPSIITTSILVLLSACGGGGSHNAEAPAGNSSMQMAVSAEAPGANCSDGGSKIQAGLDADGSGALDAAEVSSTQYLCKGASALSGTASSAVPMSMASEPPGANCPGGGRKVTAWFDANQNGQFDPGEVSDAIYVCDAGPAPAPGFPWVDVQQSLQAEPDTGYVARNETQEVVITLPANLDVGAVVRVQGAGAGGWRIAQNDGQEVKAQSLGIKAGDTWTERNGSVGPHWWRAVASSADGKKLVVVALDDIYTSTDSGLTWTRRYTGISGWFAVASSADGTKLVAAQQSGLIYVSINSGETWDPAPNSPSGDWQAVASSVDGSKLVAAGLGGQIYTSVNGGEWKPDGPSANWWSLASSADGTKLAAVGGSGIYVSTTSSINSDENWMPDGPVLADPNAWNKVTMSSDGSRLTAVATNTPIYTWTEATGWTEHQSSRDWYVVATSDDGRTIAAFEWQGPIHTSTDGGASWTASGPSPREWWAAASSADGSKLVAVDWNTSIVTSTSTTTPGIGGSISGGSTDGISLVYRGNGVFDVQSHDGSGLKVQ